MSIADREQRAHRVYGHEQRGAGHQVLVVDVAGMNARRAEEAYMIASVAVDYHVTQVVDGTKGIHGMIPKSIFVGQ
jgi:acetamidase/formamidase